MGTSLQVVLGKLDSNTQKNETGALFYTIHKNKFKMWYRPKCGTWNHKNPRIQGINLLTSGIATFFLDVSPEARETKTKINYRDYIKIERFCTMQEKNQQN